MRTLALSALFTLLLAAGAAAAPARLVYVTGEATGTGVVVAASASGAGAHRLGPGDTPSLSPNGAYVAVQIPPTLHRQPSLVLYHWSGGVRARTLISGGDYIQPVGFSADSRYIAVVLGGTRLFTIDVASGAKRAIAHGAILGASWSPAAPDRIVYALASSQLVTAPSNVWVSGADGSGRTQLTHDGTSVNPLWGPQQIVYDEEQQRANDAPIYELWLIEPDGTGARQLTNMSVPSLLSGLAPLAFSADGGRLLATYGGQDTDEAWTVDVATGQASELNGTSGLLIPQGLSRDGSTVLAVQGPFDDVAHQMVVTVPFGGGTAHVIAAHGAQPVWNR